MPNLIDRMKSEQSSKQNGNALLPKNGTLSATTPKSNYLSEQIDLIQKQSEALKKVSSERDLLLKEGRPRDREQIQKLSSEILMLRNTVQQKSEMIVQLNARIEKLNASDLQLKNAEEKELRNTKKEKYLEELALDVERREHHLTSEQKTPLPGLLSLSSPFLPLM